MVAQISPNSTVVRDPRTASQTEPIVYVVDDDVTTLDSIKDLVETLDIPVKTFAAADRFLRAYDAARPGCLLLDLRMPGMGGLDLLRVLRDRGIALPVIVLTGYGDVPTVIDAFKTGVDEFLEKPCKASVLLKYVRQAVALDMRQRAERADIIKAQERLSRLTEREAEVLRYVARQWLSSKEIAQRLKIARKTVEAHRAKIMEKTGAQSVAELVWLFALATNINESRFATARLTSKTGND
jgi:two-component system, LuxR family, response regulator FixJ